MDEGIPLDVRRIRQERPLAFQVVLRNWQIVWLPKSHVRNHRQYRGGDWDCTLWVSAWIAAEKGLI